MTPVENERKTNAQENSLTRQGNQSEAQFLVQLMSQTGHERSTHQPASYDKKNP